MQRHSVKDMMDALKKQFDDIDQSGNILQFVLKRRFEGYDYDDWLEEKVAKLYDLQAKIEKEMADQEIEDKQ